MYKSGLTGEILLSFSFWSQWSRCFTESHSPTGSVSTRTWLNFPMCCRGRLWASTRQQGCAWSFLEVINAVGKSCWSVWALRVPHFRPHCKLQAFGGYEPCRDGAHETEGFLAHHGFQEALGKCAFWQPGKPLMRTLFAQSNRHSGTGRQIRIWGTLWQDVAIQSQKRLKHWPEFWKKVCFCHSHKLDETKEIHGQIFGLFKFL